MRFNNDIIGFCNSNSKLVNGDRLNRLTISSHNGHCQTRHAHIKDGHRCTVDESYANFFTSLKKRRPVLIRRITIHQEGIGIACYIGYITITHAHLIPHGAIIPGLRNTFGFYFLPKITCRTLIKIVVMAHFFKPGINPVWRSITPVR